MEDPDTSCATESSTTMQIIAVFYLLLILVVTLMLFQRLLGDPLVRSVEEGSEHRLPRREWREIVLREQAGALPERGVEIRFSDTTLRETSETRPQPLPARRLHLR